MSDSDFVDVGDELVVRIAGYPVGKATVWDIDEKGVHVHVMADAFILPLDFKDYDVTDGVAHVESPYIIPKKPLNVRFTEDGIKEL